MDIRTRICSDARIHTHAMTYAHSHSYTNTHINNVMHERMHTHSHAMTYAHSLTKTNTGSCEEACTNKQYNGRETGQRNAHHSDNAPQSKETDVLCLGGEDSHGPTGLGRRRLTLAPHVVVMYTTYPWILHRKA